MPRRRSPAATSVDTMSNAMRSRQEGVLMKGKQWEPFSASQFCTSRVAIGPWQYLLIGGATTPCRSVRVYLFAPPHNDFPSTRCLSNGMSFGCTAATASGLRVRTVISLLSLFLIMLSRAPRHNMVWFVFLLGDARSDWERMVRALLTVGMEGGHAPVHEGCYT